MHDKCSRKQQSGNAAITTGHAAKERLTSTSMLLMLNFSMQHSDMHVHHGQHQAQMDMMQ